MWLPLVDFSKITGIPVSSLYSLAYKDKLKKRQDRFKKIEDRWYVYSDSVEFKDKQTQKQELFKKYNERLQKYWEKNYE